MQFSRDRWLDEEVCTVAAVCCNLSADSQYVTNNPAFGIESYGLYKEKNWGQI